MLASYTFNTTYRPNTLQHEGLPNLRLLEGGKFQPGQYAPVLVKAYNQVRLRYFQWGMIPAWSKYEPKPTPKLIAPADQVFRHPAYQVPIRRRRCLIPADGLYFRARKAEGSTDIKLSNPKQEAFCLAGIYDSWKSPDGSQLMSFSLIVVPAKGKYTALGLHMPLMLPTQVEGAWLDPYTDLNKISKMLGLAPSDQLTLHTLRELKVAPATGLAA